MAGRTGGTRKWRWLIPAWGLAMLPAWGAGEQSHPLPNPISASGKPWAFDGFVVSIPAEDGWYSLAKDAHYAELTKAFSADTQASAIVDARRAEEDVTKEAELLALLRKTQTAPADVATMKLVDYSAESWAAAGVSCARFSARFDDRRTDDPARVMLIVRGVSCVRPNMPDWIVTLKYIQRGPAADLLPELSKVGDPFLASLRLSPWDPSVLRKARVAAGQTPEESIQLLSPQAERGDGEAALLLGNMYLYGQGVAREYAPARKWLDVAAKDGHPDALFNLGAIYDKALGVDRDAPQAVKWFTLAADQRDAEAQLNLALFYIKGDGVAKDIAAAEQWLRRAADNGNSRAQRILAEGKYKQQ